MRLFSKAYLENLKPNKKRAIGQNRVFYGKDGFLKNPGFVGVCRSSTSARIKPLSQPRYLEDKISRRPISKTPNSPNKPQEDPLRHPPNSPMCGLSARHRGSDCSCRDPSSASSRCTHSVRIYSYTYVHTCVLTSLTFNVIITQSMCNYERGRMYFVLMYSAYAEHK